MEYANPVADLPLDCADTVVAAVVLVAIAAATTCSGLRALFAGDSVAHRACRRWALAAPVALIGWYALACCLHVEPRFPALVGVAVASCWLILIGWPPRQLPRAVARRRSS